MPKDSRPLRIGLLSVLFVQSFSFATPETAAPPDEWTDAKTGHKVIRLSRREGNNGISYFHQNVFTADGDKMVFLGSTEKGSEAFTVDLKTLEIRSITPGRGVSFEVVAPKRRELFYLSGDTVYSTHLDTLVTRAISQVPAYYAYGRGFSVNASETQLLGCYAKGEEAFYQKPREQWIVDLFEARLPNALYTIDIDSGAIDEFYHENAWLGHAQFSPTDPTLVEFCHEGPERRIDRMWLVRTDGTGLRSLHARTVPNEMETHEFWDPDGAHVWFDLQIPWFLPKVRAVSAIVPPRTYLARINLDTGEETRYRLARRYYSWHYNTSSDGRMFCGDGEGRFFELGRPGKFLFLYRTDEDKLRAEPLCSMAKHTYTIAPNARFTPDGTWVAFQSDMYGTTQVYAVEVERSLPAAEPPR